MRHANFVSDFQRDVAVERELLTDVDVVQAPFQHRERFVFTVRKQFVVAACAVAVGGMRTPT